MTKKRDERYPVWFNSADHQLFMILKKKNQTSRSWIDFVKDSFRDKVDELQRDLQ